MRLKINYTKIWTTCLLIAGSILYSFSQTFEIVDHTVDHKNQQIDLFIKGEKDGNFFLPMKEGAYIATEIKTTDPTNVGKMNILRKSLKKYDAFGFRILFLVDKSGSMRGAKFQQAKAAIKSALTKYSLPDDVASFSFFNESTTPSQIVNTKNFESVIGGIDVEPPGYGQDTHLYNSLKEKVDEWKSFKGRKIIVFLSDGQNDIYGDDKELNEPFLSGSSSPVSKTQLITHIKKLDEEFRINCIGFGADVDSMVLKEIVKATPNPDDEFTFAATPDDIGAIVEKITEGEIYNLKLSVRPDDFCVYKGESRVLSLNFLHEGKVLKTNYAYSNGQSGAGTLDYCNSAVYYSFFDLLPYSIGYVLLLLLLFTQLLPFVSRRLFKMQKVKKYKSIKKEGIIKKDPITTLALRDEDLVVDVCGHVNLYQSWKDNGDKCGEKNCVKGYTSHSSNSNFFSQSSDITRRLNWIWFGAIGGAIGWLFFNIFSLIEKDFYTGFFSLLSNKGYFDSYHQAMNTGAGLGFGIAFAFAIVEENGQSRDLNYSRIFIRAILGLLFGGLIFLLITLLFMNVTQQLGYASYLISWLMFGVFIAVLTSFQSAIEWKNALLAGMAASVVGFMIYSTLTDTNIFSNKQIGKVISMITYGGILGVVMDSVRDSLEDFYLEYVSPAHVRRKNPISKWLKGSVPEVTIGKKKGAYVYIKWEDPAVQQEHAALTYENGKVYISPKAQTIVNGQEVKSKKALNNNDLIKLGHSSVTTIRFKSTKKSEKEAVTPTVKNKNKPASAIEFYDDQSVSNSNQQTITFDD